MTVNPGKKFENDFQKSINKEEVFIHRLKDGATRTGANGEMIRLKNKNLCDFILFKGNKLVLVELKSFLGKSMSFSNIKNTIEEQEKFICNLLQETKKENIKAYFVLNFRELEETYAIEMETFNEFYNNTDKKSINISDVKKLGKKLAQYKKRTSYRYNVDNLFN